MNHKFNIIIFTLGILFVAPLTADEESVLSTSIELGLQSQYLTQGFKDIDHGGLYTLSAGVAKGNVRVEFWGASGTAMDYQELNLTLGYDWAYNALEGTVSYTWLGFYDHEGNSDDTEVVLSMVHTAVPWLPSVEWVYSSQANGHNGIFEWAYDHEYEAHRIRPYAQLGIDYGYLSPEYDGLNHFALGGVWEHRLTEQIGAQVNLIHYWGLGNMERAHEPDRLLSSIALVAEF